MVYVISKPTFCGTFSTAYPFISIDCECKGMVLMDCSFLAPPSPRNIFELFKNRGCIGAGTYYCFGINKNIYDIRVSGTEFRNCKLEPHKAWEIAYDLRKGIINRSEMEEICEGLIT